MRVVLSVEAEADLDGLDPVTAELVIDDIEAWERVGPEMIEVVTSIDRQILLRGPFSQCLFLLTDDGDPDDNSDIWMLERIIP